MAKRHLSYEQLSGIEGHFKPQGTLGRHDCLVTRHGGELVVVGSVSGWATLQPGDVLGYNSGAVWLLPQPEEYKDPIRRVLAQAHLSQRLLLYSREGVQTPQYYFEYAGSYYCDIVAVVGGYQREILWVIPEKTNQCGELLEVVPEETMYGYQGGEALIVMRLFGRSDDRYAKKRVYSVVVRPTADKEEVAAWLAAILEEKFLHPMSSSLARMMEPTLRSVSSMFLP